MKCVKRFSEGDADSYALTLEQETFTASMSVEGPSRSIRNNVPTTKPAQNKGSMIVAGTLVGNRFFSDSFGVSFNLISAIKANSAALRNLT